MGPPGLGALKFGWHSGQGLLSWGVFLHTLPPPRGLPPPASPCRVYAGIPGIHRNSMQADPRSRPFRGLPVREGELSRRWGASAPSSSSRTMEA